MQKRMLAAAVTLVALLSACSSPSPPATHTATPTATPVFATDAAALAAAEDAYAKYLMLSNIISGHGGTGGDQMQSLVTPSEYQNEIDGFRIFATSKLHTEGRSKVTNTILQHNEIVQGSAHVTIYSCVDNSAVRLFNEKLADVTPANRPNLQPSKILLVGSAPSSTSLLIAEVQPWSGSGVC